MITKKQLIPNAVLWWTAERNVGHVNTAYLNDMPIKIVSVDEKNDKFTAVRFNYFDTQEFEISQCLPELRLTDTAEVNKYFELRKIEINDRRLKIRKELEAEIKFSNLIDEQARIFNENQKKE